MIEKLFKVRKDRFRDHPGIPPSLDLVEEDDRITHQISLDDEDLGSKENTMDECNVFQFDPNYTQTEAEWDEIKKEILGEEEDKLNEKGGVRGQDGEDLNQPDQNAQSEEEDNNEIQDMTEKDLINLRRTIYLAIMSSVDFQECCHKLLKLNVRQNQQQELCTMVLECCMQERTFSRFYGLLAQRLCQLVEVYQDCFQRVFVDSYETIHRLEVNKLRNAGKLFAHLLYTDSIEWRCLAVVRLTEEDTTSASRIFVKILFQEIAENMGVEMLARKLATDEVKPHLTGLFPKDSVENARFSVNFYTSIGLGLLTEDLREFLKNAPKLLLDQKYAELLAQAAEAAK